MVTSRLGSPLMGLKAHHLCVDSLFALLAIMGDWPTSICECVSH